MVINKVVPANRLRKRMFLLDGLDINGLEIVVLALVEVGEIPVEADVL